MRLPAWLNPRRLEGRIVGLFLGLLLVVQVVSVIAIRASITHNAEASLAAELKTGERLLRRLLDQRAGKLHDAAELLAKDYGFRTTIGLSLAEAGTVETIKDALVNQGERIGASVVAYFDVNEKLVAATRDGAASFGAALQQTAKSQDGTALAVLGDHVYQVVAVQVRTPAPVGWVLMGFELDRQVLDDLKALSSLESVVLLQPPHQPWLSIVANLDAAPAASLRHAMGSEPPTDGVLELGNERLRARFVPLLRGEQRLGVLLLRSLDAALAPYRQLQLVLLGLTVLGVAVFALVSVLLARGISGPIRALSGSARRLERGDYDTPVPSASPLYEVNKLAVALESMREGIRRRDAQVAHLAYVDQLTLLPNRARFAEYLRDHLRYTDTPGAVLMLDLDRFKHVNDVLGHEVGDRLLQSVAERLRALCDASPNAVLARLSGDEFAILLTQSDARMASEAALEILKNFENPLHIDNETIDLGAGIGIALFPEHGLDVNMLLGRAELAMYAAKTRQCGSLIYHAQLDAGSQESLSLLTELRHAVENEELRLFLQPKVDLQQGRVVGAEALVRWQHPTRGLVPPMQFIPFAEQTGFIRLLSAWVLLNAARFARQARDAGLDLQLSVNLSTRDLMDQDLPAKIESMLAPLEVPAESLCLEITESAIMDDPERALSTLEHLHAMGLHLSIDDFGTGYSSLAYLKRLPVDELKIDGSFVMAMERDLDDARIVRSTIELAHNLGLTVVAEGLETAKAWAVLQRLGCDEGQGYYISKPMPQEQFIAWAQGWTPPDASSLTAESMMAKLG